MIGVIYITYADIQKRIRRRKIRFRIFMFIIVLSTIGIYMFTYPIIKVKSIEVSGNNIVPTDKIIALSEINKGDNMLKLNMRRIRENIYTNPYVEVCKVKRSVLGYVYITISERMNAGIAPYNGKYVTFDKKGVIIEILDKLDGINLPLISGLNIKSAMPGKLMEVSDQRQLEAVKIIFDGITTSDLSDIISGVDITNLLSIILKTNHGFNIEIGTVDNIDKKLMISKEIIEKDILKRELKGTLDVSFEGNPVFRLQ
jgi:cell division protein FtsQ